MYRMSDLSPMYRDRNTMARNNSENREGSVACFQPLRDFLLPLPAARASAGRELVRSNSHCQLSCLDADSFGRVGRMRP
jgi:hypothetical protein